MSSSSYPVNSAAYQAIGGLDGCRKLVAASFYSLAQRDPALRPFFPRPLPCPIEGLALFLAQFLGGSCDYSKRRWSLSLREAHLRFQIGPKESDAWWRTMHRALAGLEIDQPSREHLDRFFERASAYLVNQGAIEVPASHPAADEVAQRWQVHQTLEDTIAAVRAPDADRALALLRDTGLQAYFARDRAALLSLLAVMSAGQSAQLLDFVESEIAQHPGLVRERYTYGRTLLHDAAGAGTVRISRALLQSGADPNAIDQFGHRPLYYLGNSMQDAPDARELVQLLADAGADLDAKDHVKQCAPLHMAARRGNVSVANALLDCGANLEALDCMRDTPLRPAVNCGKANVAALLLARGADAHSVGSKGLTAGQAARGATMKALFNRSAAL